MNDRVFLIGIAGGTGSGKTTVARDVCQRHAHLGAVVIDQDSYYRDRSHLTPDERAAVNYDEPSAIDHDLLFEHLQALLRHESIAKPCYDFTTHTRTSSTLPVEPKPLVIIEGLFALSHAKTRDLYGLKVYVSADSDIRFIRRLQRDVADRGRTVDSVIAQYLGTVRPMHERHIEPTRVFADLVLDSRQPLETSRKLLDESLNRLLHLGGY